MIHNHFSVILKNSTCENMLQWPFHRAWWVSKNTTTYKDSSQPFTCVKTLHREQIKAPAQPQTPQHSRDTGKKQWKWLQLSTNPKEREKGKRGNTVEWKLTSEMGDWHVRTTLFEGLGRLILQNHPGGKSSYISGEFIWIGAVSLQGKPKGLLFNRKMLQKFFYL